MRGAVKPDATQADIDKVMEGGGGDSIFTEHMLASKNAQARAALEDVKEKHADIQKLEKSIEELHQLFVDLSVLVESQGINGNMPDIAFTVSASGWYGKEGKVLDFAWPSFGWVTIRDGFLERNDEFLPLGDDEVLTGTDCPLIAGYNRTAGGGADSGRAPWPVWCILGSDRKLQGRFGDKVWSFLDLTVLTFHAPLDFSLFHSLSTASFALGMRSALPIGIGVWTNANHSELA